MEPHANDLIGKVVELAKGDDSSALQLCIDRLTPLLRTHDHPVQFLLIGESLAELGPSVHTAMANGTLSPEQGSRILSALTGQARLMELDDIEERIAALEAKLGDNP